MQTTATPGKTRYGRSRDAERTASHDRRAPGRAELPRIVTVFRGTDERLYHGWCGRALEFHGSRAGIELDYYCPRCIEHVSVPECIVPRIPRGVPAPDASARDAR